MAGEWRKVPLGTLEGATADHTDYEYQFGAEIEGVFVPAVTKSGGYVDHLIAIGKENTPAEQPTSDTPASTATTGEPSDPSSSTQGA